MMDLRRTFALPLSRIVACIVAFAWGSGVASAQSLGELAKREEARRAAIKSSGKIYTNDNVRSEPAPRGAAPVPAPAAAPSSSAPATPPSPSGIAPPAAAAAGTEKPADGATSGT